MGRLWGLFSTGTEKKDILEFSGIGSERVGEKGARIGLIFSQGPDPRIHIPVLWSSILSLPSAVINGTAIPAENFNLEFTFGH
jgi:hypothetical protein